MLINWLLQRDVQHFDMDNKVTDSKKKHIPEMQTFIFACCQVKIKSYFFTHKTGLGYMILNVTTNFTIKFQEQIAHEYTLFFRYHKLLMSEQILELCFKVMLNQNTYTVSSKSSKTK